MAKPTKIEIPLAKAAFRKQFTYAMETMGFDSKYYYRKARLPVKDPEDLESLIPLRPLYRLAAMVAMQENMPDFGSKVAQLTPWHKVESLIPIIRRCKTLGELLEIFCEKAPSQRSHADFRVLKGDSISWFGYHGPAILKHDVQLELYRFTGMIQLVQLAAGSGWHPEQVELHMPEIDISKACSFIRRSKLTFSCEVCRFPIPNILLNLPVNFHIPETQTSHPGHYNINGNFIDTLRQLIPIFLERGTCKISDLAYVAELEVRTLQRRIKSQGTSFNQLLSEERFALAKSKLLNRSTTTMVAAQLGYTDSAHFIRAFRRWSGLTPGEFKKVNLKQASEKS